MPPHVLPACTAAAFRRTRPLGLPWLHWPAQTLMLLPQIISSPTALSLEMTVLDSLPLAQRPVLLPWQQVPCWTGRQLLHTKC
ncbi:hypothetical protein DPMN_004382 [Dreissena polymorpha]|uniref:Uncharacterized protein n=1 Tax=Dreissena polymorpha TaxID=45954 RepID=A0A9D4RVM1_DREPO|nr:hypothetical protein DPMN_004382 [Dreissena polymorpha]